MQAMQPIMMMLVMFGIFYFILIRPQVKRQSEHQAVLKKLDKGDEVISQARDQPLLEIVTDNNTVAVLELQEKVRVRVPRAYIEGRWEGKVPETAAKSAA